MASREFTVRLDGGRLGEALEEFDHRAADVSSADGFVDELLALLDRGELFRVVRSGEAYEVEPTEAFYALLADMA